MITDAEVLERLRCEPLPKCVELFPYEVLSASADGTVEVLFQPQPAFENHFGNVMGGLAVAFVDVIVSYAAFAVTHSWPPTLEIKTSYLRPLQIGVCRGEGRVLRKGKRFVFTEGLLMDPDGQPAVHATATQAVI